jgi:2-isopropylmalate synthase
MTPDTSEPSPATSAVNDGAPRRIRIFDTTLRDGEQSPGATMTAPEKVRIARELEALGVDVLEAGFPRSSPHEAEAVREVARAVQGPIVAGLARAVDADIDAAADAVADAVRPRIHTFLATSGVHLERKLRITPDQCLERVDRAVRRARSHVDDVEFSAEDATRTDLDFLCRVAEVAATAGALTINLPDTVGYAHPADVARMFDAVRGRLDGAEPTTSCSASTAMTTSAWRWPTRSRRSSTGPARSSAP